MDLYKKNSFIGERLRERNLTWVDIFEEILIKVSNSTLISTFKTGLEPASPVTQCDFDCLQLSKNPFVQRNMEFFIECMDDLIMERKFQYYYHNLSHQQIQQQAWLQKRRAENMARKTAREEPLPEEGPSNPIFKPIHVPSCLDGYLVTN